MANFRHDGDIEYLGRIDTQVKIRGFRVELGEIESVISSFTDINDITVVDYGAHETHKRLVAYYVSKKSCDIEKLKEHISCKLPDYMVPVFYINIETIPRLSSGKINRLALPDPEISIKKRAKYLAPSSDIEHTLVEIWARILKIPASKIGIHDSFFDMGGDSLMAIQFVCEAEDSDLIFETNTLFTNNTIADLAKVTRNEPQVKLVIDQANVSGTYPLLPRQAKFFADDFEVPHHWNRFFFFDIDHDVNVENIKTAFDRILVHHDNMRVSFVQSQDGAWLQDCAAELPSTPYVFTHDLTGLSLPLQEDEIIRLSNNYRASLDITCAPLLRIVHFKCSGTSGKLGIVIHHLLLDMVSSRIIFEDFLKVYEGLRFNLNPILPAKTTSAKYWSMHLGSVAQDHDFSEELAYWGTSAMDPVPTLTGDFGGVAVAVESSSGQEIIILERDYTAALLQHIPRTYDINIQDFMLGCLLETSSEWTGEDNLVVNICGHGRDSVKGFDLTRTVAWANTVYPIHLSVNKDMKNSELDLFRGIQDQLSNVPSQNGHYNILRYTAKNTDILRNRTPDIFFNYVSQIDALLSEGISFQPVLDPPGIISSSGENHLCYLLYIEAGVVDKCLTIRITYSQDFFMAKTISEFSQRFKDRIIDNLQALLLNKEAIHVAS